MRYTKHALLATSVAVAIAGCGSSKTSSSSSATHSASAAPKPAVVKATPVAHVRKVVHRKAVHISKPATVSVTTSAPVMTNTYSTPVVQPSLGSTPGTVGAGATASASSQATHAKKKKKKKNTGGSGVGVNGQGY